MLTVGHHLLAEYWDCAAALDDTTAIEAALRTAAEVARVRVIQAVFHRFSPHGVSGMLLIAESHISIHTWPEVGYAAVDVYTCGSGDLLVVHNALAAALQSGRSSVVQFVRGEGLAPRVLNHDER